MYRKSTIGLTVLLGAVVPSFAQAPTKAELPKVVLIGDSIRLGYAPLVARRLAGKAVVVSPNSNGGDSANIRKNLEEWVIREKPAVVHFNCGLHDLKRSQETKRYQVAVGQYQANLIQIVERLRKGTSAALVFANTTPILDERHAKRKAGFDRFEADVQRYNQAALEVMHAGEVPVDDLHWIVEQNGPDQMLGADGTHYTPAGYERLAEAVTDCVLRQLYIVRHPGALPATPDPQAAVRYQKAQAERDAQVPKAYKNLAVGTFQVPRSADDWKRQRPEVLKTVLQSLGDLPPRPSPSRGRIVSRELRRDYTLERVAIANTEASDVSALLLIPEKRQQPAPAILWLHSSTPDKNQIITPNTNGGTEPLGETLVRAGYIVMAPDACWYGDRAELTPAGTAEADRAAHESLFKFNLWMGRTLWGMFVRDDQVALDYLCSRAELDKGRIGATGMSMGSTRSWWLAAVDDRIAAAVGVACLTRYQNLIAHGELRAHGVYYFVNGLLKHFDTEGVVALIAPRPFLALTGELDRGSPADGVKVIEDRARQAYAAVGAPERFKSILYPNTGHIYTPQMRAEMLAWFDRWLKPR
jgi:lysophospholipase L1-like esterase/dienelactone hydrolase